MEHAANAYLQEAAVPDELESDHHTADDSVRGAHSGKQTQSDNANFTTSNDWDVVCATETSMNHRRLCRGAVFEVIRVRRNKIKVIRYYEVIKKKNGARYYYRKKFNHDCGKSPGGGARVVTTCSGHPDHFMLTTANYDELGNVTVVERAGENKNNHH